MLAEKYMAYFAEVSFKANIGIDNMKNELLDHCCEYYTLKNCTFGDVAPTTAVVNSKAK